MQKISTQDAASLLKQAGAAIRALVSEREDLSNKVASYEKRERMEKIARSMEEKGLSSDLTFDQKMAALNSAPSLDVTEEAIKLAAPQGKVFGDLSDVAGNSMHPFEQFIMTGEDPS